MDRLKASYDTISILEKDKDSANRMHQEAHRMIRVMTVMREYIAECDDAYGEERAILPLGRQVIVIYLNHCVIHIAVFRQFSIYYPLSFLTAGHAEENT